MIQKQETPLVPCGQCEISSAKLVSVLSVVRQFVYENANWLPHTFLLFQIRIGNLLTLRNGLGRGTEIWGNTT